MKIELFEKRIAHLDQIDIVTGATDTLFRLLIKKGITTEAEVQRYFLAWMRDQGLTKKKSRKRASSA